MQPLRFNPLLKQTLWGGERIIPFKHLDSNLTQVGESWEISSVPGNETTVKGGPYDGKILSEVIAEEKEKLVGATCYKHFGKELPLLIKFIDAAQPLSIQVHPDDETARKQGHERGKNEMWYIMDDTPGASLMAGLKTQITPAEYEQMVANDTITDAISHYDVKEGDCFYLPAGRIIASARAASWPRSSRLAMSPTASTTSSERTRTATTVSSTPVWLPRASTTMCRTTTARSMS